MSSNFEERLKCLFGKCDVFSSSELFTIKLFGVLLGVFILLVVCLSMAWLSMQRRKAQRASGLAQLEKDEVFDKQNHRKIRKKWLYCTLFRLRDCVHVWIRPGLSLADVELQMPRIYPRDIVLSVVQDAGVWRWFGSDFKAIFPAKSKLIPPKNLKHPPRAAVIGRDEILGKAAIVPFNENGLLLIGGLNGQGKTSLLQTFAEAKNQTSTEIFSFSGADFPKISALELCEKLEDWKSQIEAFDFKRDGQKQQDVLIIDEFLRYEHEEKAIKERLEKLVGFVASEGRKYGFCLILAAQTWANASSPMFGRAGARIAFRLANAQQGEVFVQDRRAALLAKGHVIAVGFEFALAQTWFRETQKTQSPLKT